MTLVISPGSKLPLTIYLPITHFQWTGILWRPLTHDWGFHFGLILSNIVLGNHFEFSGVLSTGRFDCQGGEVLTAFHTNVALNIERSTVEEPGDCARWIAGDVHRNDERVSSLQRLALYLWLTVNLRCSCERKFICFRLRYFTYDRRKYLNLKKPGINLAFDQYLTKKIHRSKKKNSYINCFQNCKISLLLPNGRKMLTEVQIVIVHTMNSEFGFSVCSTHFVICLAPVFSCIS